MYFVNLTRLSIYLILVVSPLIKGKEATDSRTTTQGTSPKKKPWAPNAVLVVSETNISADCTRRPSVTINGTSPGPVLRFKACQSVWIRVINQLQSDSTTLHFHGLAQFGSPFADGTVLISQVPIPPNGGYFDYEFRLPCDSAGTYLYHTHHKFQSLTAYGSFIIEEYNEPPPYQYDEELNLMFADYYHATDAQIVAGLAATPIKFLGEPQSLLVNGQAFGSCNASSLFGCSNGCHPYIAHVKPDKTYRVRVTGITALTFIYFAIESHSNLKLIEVDGGYVKKATTPYIQIGSGQRYSFLLKTKSSKKIKKRGNRDFYGRVESRWRAKRDTGAFILRYDVDDPPTSTCNKSSNANCSPPESIHQTLNFSNPPADINKTAALPDEGDEWLTSTFRPLFPVKHSLTASQVTRRIIISSQQIKSDKGKVNWFVNNKTYAEGKPKVPLLIKAYSNGLKPNYAQAIQNNGYDASLDAYPIKLGEVIEFLIINLASSVNVSEAHPWHFHGRRFSMIGQGVGEFTEEEYKKINKDSHLKNKRSIERDTQVVFAGKGGKYEEGEQPSGTHVGWLVVRLIADTPGAFLVHCHLQVHAIMGMMIAVLIGIENLPPLPKDFLKEYTSPQGVRLKEPFSYFDLVDKNKKPPPKKLQKKIYF